MCFSEGLGILPAIERRGKNRPELLITFRVRRHL